MVSQIYPFAEFILEFNLSLKRQYHQLPETIRQIN